jgi:high-affinity Fe2+/Pb2+ permease
LLSQEVQLAKVEGQEELRQVKSGAVTFGIGLGIAAVGGWLLILMLVYMLAALTDIPLWGCYGIVGGVLGLLGVVFLVKGKRQVEDVDVLPQTVETMKENVQWLKEQTTSDTRSRTPVRP